MKHLNSEHLAVLCSAAASAARAAGRYVQSQFGQQFAVHEKTGGDSLASQVVTAVDLAAQGIVLDGLKSVSERFDLGLLTEETPDDHSRAEKAYFWCIDPIDGTLPFVERRPGYAVSIALIAKAGDPVIGVAYIPDLDDCYTAIKGQGVALNGKPLTRPTAGSDDRVVQVCMDNGFQSAPYYDLVAERFASFVDGVAVKAVAYHMKYGGVRNAIAVMSAHRGCYFKFPKANKGGGSIWDYAATRLFFEELGLHVSDAHGQRLHLNNPNTTFMNHCGVVYATDRALADFILGIGEEAKGR